MKKISTITGLFIGVSASLFCANSFAYLSAGYSATLCNETTTPIKISEFEVNDKNWEKYEDETQYRFENLTLNSGECKGEISYRVMDYGKEMVKIRLKLMDTENNVPVYSFQIRNNTDSGNKKTKIRSETNYNGSNIRAEVDNGSSKKYNLSFRDNK